MSKLTLWMENSDAIDYRLDIQREKKKALKLRLFVLSFVNTFRMNTKEAH